MQALLVNSVIEWCDVLEPRYDRILEADPFNATIVVIDITSVDDYDAVSPVIQPYDTIVEAIRTAKARIVDKDKDPYLQKILPKQTLPVKAQRRAEEFWNIIKPIIDHEDHFHPNVRAEIISETSKRTGTSCKTIRRLLRRYWRGGQTEQALLPRYNDCGRKRKEDSVYEKLGRSKGTNGDTPPGVNMTLAIKEDFRSGIKLYYENEKGRTLLHAYRKTLETFFHKGKYPKHDVMVPLLPWPDEAPSFRQFEYFYKKNYSVVDATLAREGQRAHDLKYRAIPGDSTLGAAGPGYIVQLDPTIGDVYLVSEFDRTRIVGRPVIYIIIDVFSHLIMGMSVRLEAPSWFGATLALENMVTDKVEFCREHGYIITEADWPSHHLPKAIFADRGELLAKNSDFLQKDFGIKVITAPPYRPDLKALVERHFRTFNDDVIDWVPGAVINYPERGERDYRLDACLTLFELRQLLIGCIIVHNTSRKIKDYPRDKDMIADNVQAYPARLWDWGVQNRYGSLREQPSDTVRIKLLPKEKASITPEGIRFKGIYYECELAWEQKWFEQARVEGCIPVDIAYDPRTVDRIYLRPDAGRTIETCTLMPKEQMWRGFDWQDIEDRRALDKVLGEGAYVQARQAEVEINTKQERIISDAKTKTKSARKGMNKADITRGIDENRAEELKYEHQKDLQTLGVALSPRSTPTHLTAEEFEEDSYRAKQVQWLRQMRNEGLNDAKQ